MILTLEIVDAHVVLGIFSEKCGESGEIDGVLAEHFRGRCRANDGRRRRFLGRARWWRCFYDEEMSAGRTSCAATNPAGSRLKQQTGIDSLLQRQCRSPL